MSSSYSFSLNPAVESAPPVNGMTPPDQQPMTFGEHLMAALAMLDAAGDDITPEDQEYLGAFLQGLQMRAMQSQMKNQGMMQPGQGGPPGPNMMGGGPGAGPGPGGMSGSPGFPPGGPGPGGAPSAGAQPAAPMGNGLTPQVGPQRAMGPGAVSLPPSRGGRRP